MHQSFTDARVKYSVKNEAILRIVGTSCENVIPDDLYVCPPHTKVTDVQLSTKYVMRIPGGA